MSPGLQVFMAADKNTSAMAILAYNYECQLSTVGTYYRHPVYFQYIKLLSLGAFLSQCMQSKSKKILQTRGRSVEHIPRTHIVAQSIDLFSVHGYNFVNLREIMEMLVSCSGDT